MGYRFHSWPFGRRSKLFQTKELKTMARSSPILQLLNSCNSCDFHLPKTSSLPWNPAMLGSGLNGFKSRGSKPAEDGGEFPRQTRSASEAALGGVDVRNSRRRGRN